MNIGKLEKVPLRELWKHEEKDFNNWLADNLEILGKELGVNISFVQRGKEVGRFACDLLAEDDKGDNVVIECQLDKTNHDHLGKIITYLTGLDAKRAIWICKEPCAEHINAITWLNESTLSGISFYLVTIEAVRIGESEAAPLFKVVCSPSTEGKETGKKKEELATRHIKRLEFWEQLLGKSRVKMKLFSKVKPLKDNWIAAGAGKTGIVYTYLINMDSAYVQLYMDKGKDSENTNKERFDFLHAEKDTIQKVFAGNLDWISEPRRRSTVVRAKVCDIGLKDEERWDEIQEAMVDTMSRFEKALKPYIAKLES